MWDDGSLVKHLISIGNFVLVWWGMGSNPRVRVTIGQAFKSKEERGKIYYEQIEDLFAVKSFVHIKKFNLIKPLCKYTFVLCILTAEEHKT